MSRLFWMVVVSLALLACGEEAESTPKTVDEMEAEAEADSPGASAGGECALDTGFDGDDLCQLAPDPNEGMQLHFGPSNYDDPADVEQYLLAPGEEALNCAYITTPNQEEIFYDDWKNTLRPLSHHLIVAMIEQGVTEGPLMPCTQGNGINTNGIVGGNTTALEPFEDVAPENDGLARTIPARVGVEMQLHFFNTSDEPILMEAWQNIYYMDPDTVREQASPLAGYAGLGMAVQPGTSEVISGRMRAPADIRVTDLYSHNHDHTLRFSAYVTRSGEERELIYESYEWDHPLYLPLDSVHENDAGDRDTQRPGGMTGPLELLKGDVLEWECEIYNHDLTFPLNFANKAHDAEMCILRGNYAPSTGQAWLAYLQ